MPAIVQARPRPHAEPRRPLFAPGEYIVKFRAGAAADQVHDFAARQGGSIIRKLLNPRTWLFKFDAGERRSAVIGRLTAEPDVAWAEANGYFQIDFIPNDPLYDRQWNFQQLRTGPAWNRNRGGGAVVAIVDTGVAYENYTDGTQTYRLISDLAQTNFVPGYNFVNNTTHANDDNRHGTHVAGTVAQSTNNDRGVTGVAFRASIMPVKVLNAEGFGSFADAADGVRWAADHGADVINMSFGSSSPSNVMEEAVNYTRYDRNVVPVASAGNDGTGELGYPAAYPAVISVAATNVNKTLAWYSQYGDGLDISAPGGDTSADANHDGVADGILQQTIYEQDPTRSGYFYFQGTSMAAPHVSGVAALVKSRGFKKASAIRRAVLMSAVDIGAPGYDTRYGYGLVNANLATQFRRMKTPRITFPTSEDSLNGGRRIEITWSRRNGKGLRYHIGYTNNYSAVGTFSDDFESGVVSGAFAQGGNADWMATAATSAGGTYSARSGVIEDEQTSQMSLTQLFQSAATITFNYRVSSEANFDFLDFYIDSTRQIHVSGTAGGWMSASFSVDAGEHTFTWIYEKDGSVSTGLDAGFVDNISLPNVSQANWNKIVRTTDRGAVSYPWRVPSAAGGDYGLRIRGFNGAYGSWAYSGPFSVN